MTPHHIPHTDLHPGDLLFLYNKSHKYFMHVAVVSNKKCGDMHYWLHAVMKPTEHLHFTAPYTEERLAQYNWEVQAFRIEDKTIRERMLKIMENWVQYAVKFDNKRLATALEKSRGLLGVQWDYSQKIFPDMGSVTEETFTQAVALMKSEFDISHAIKYATRRETCPVKPAANPEAEHGFRCLMFLLTALQSAYLMDDVPAVNDKWLSLRHAQFFHPVAESYVQQNLKLEDFLQKLSDKIPDEFRLSTRFCVPEVFYHSIKNSKLVTPLGVYDPVLDADIPQEMKLTQHQAKRIDEGVQRKAGMYESLVGPRVGLCR